MDVRRSANAASAGSIAIQQSVAIVGEYPIGLFALGTLPALDLRVGTGHVYAVVSVFIGMFWNYFMYNRYVWKKQAHGAGS